jgi:hypothetical protein
MTSTGPSAAASSPCVESMSSWPRSCGIDADLHAASQRVPSRQQGGPSACGGDGGAWHLLRSLEGVTRREAGSEGGMVICMRSRLCGSVADGEEMGVWCRENLCTGDRVIRQHGYAHDNRTLTRVTGFERPVARALVPQRRAAWRLRTRRAAPEPVRHCRLIEDWVPGWCHVRAARGTVSAAARTAAA